MASNSAAYMREYRARKRTEAENALEATIAAEADDIRAASELIAENARLTEEVARLKRELAARPVLSALDRTILGYGQPTFGVSRPAPKPGRK